MPGLFFSPSTLHPLAQQTTRLLPLLLLLCMMLHMMLLLLLRMMLSACACQVAPMAAPMPLQVAAPPALYAPAAGVPIYNAPAHVAAK
jgi:hypothetical protein